MKVIINTNGYDLPKNAKSLATADNALLNLLAQLGSDPLQPPYASLLSHYHQLPGNWLVASPIHWEASHNSAMIVAGGELMELDDHTSKRYFQLFADYLAAYETSLYYHDAYTWLISIKDQPILNAKPIYRILNQHLMPELAQLDQTMYWQSFFTECQMFFATIENNPMLNGVWMWGGASLIEQSALSICADDYFLGMAQICSSNVSLYHPSLSLNNYSILLLNDFNLLSKEHQNQLHKRSISWYWNNQAYKTFKPSWFSRIWRTSINED